MTEDAIELDVPEGAQYGNKDILSVFLNRDLKTLFINYESKKSEFEQIAVMLEEKDGGWKMKHAPVGFTPPGVAKTCTHPGAMESEKMYEMMEEEWLIEVFGE